MVKPEAREILVEEIMSRRPRTGTPEMTVKEAAMLMLAEGVGSLVVIEDGQPIGILTERDLMYKVVAENKMASRIKVERIMSSPVITVSPRQSVAEAAKRMSDLHLRRLPVVDRGNLIGMLTEKDILKLSPSLIELTREWCKISGSEKGLQPNGIGYMAGYCESCGTYSTNLRLNEGMLLCPECRED